MGSGFKGSGFAVISAKLFWHECTMEGLVKKMNIESRFYRETSNIEY